MNPRHKEFCDFVAHAWMALFRGEQTTLAYMPTPDGAWRVSVNGWPQLKEMPAGAFELSWPALPPPGYSEYGCVQALAGASKVYKSIDDAVLYLLEHEAHRMGHLAVEHAAQVVRGTVRKCGGPEANPH